MAWCPSSGQHATVRWPRGIFMPPRSMTRQRSVGKPRASTSEPSSNVAPPRSCATPRRWNGTARRMRRPVTTRQRSGGGGQSFPRPRLVSLASEARTRRPVRPSGRRTRRSSPAPTGSPRTSDSCSQGAAGSTGAAKEGTGSHPARGASSGSSQPSGSAGRTTRHIGRNPSHPADEGPLIIYLGASSTVEARYAGHARLRSCALPPRSDASPRGLASFPSRTRRAWTRS